jgi:hypothetical protein
MKKRVAILVIILFTINLTCASVRINEVELNPTGDDNKYEWIELYSQAPVDLTNSILLSSNGRNISLNVSFEGYYVLTTPYNFLTNKDNTLTLKNGAGVILDSTKSLTDNNNNDYSWQYCLGNWTFANSSKGEENDCEKNTELTILVNNTNITNSTTNAQNSTSIKKTKNSTSSTLSQQTTISTTEDHPDQNNPDVIILGKSSQNNKKSAPIENSIIYKSKNEYIKEYMPYAFSLLCILLIALLAIDRNKTKIIKDND